MSVRLDSVSKSFGLTHAVDGVTVTVHPGELFAVLGPSGCGKTTLLRLIAGFERPDAGGVTVGGRLVADERTWLPPERRRIGMVFQDYALFPHLTVERNVAFGCRHADRDGPRRALELVGLQHKANSHPHELSGGERQRVALARALAPGPDVVLLDEPFSSLDATLRADLRKEVELILRDAGTSAILVTHDQEEALTLADRLALMRDGRLVQVGSPEEVYAQPAERWAAQFVGEVNVIPGVLRGDSVHTEIGSFDLVCPASGAAHGSVHVAVRPEQLEFRSGREPNAEVVEREFRGHDVLYRARHAAGRTLLVQLPSLELYEPGQQVFVRPAESARAPVVD
ncbi:MAG TPA: ABC transporter ATP-binding protein [Thermoleophilaceae bacterium]|nr:ABC transporter ATP-binding protein [Thermoleophilaceae bacterium]